MTKRILGLVFSGLVGLTVMAAPGPTYTDDEKLPARAKRECVALRESGSREGIWLGYRKGRTHLFRCQPQGRAVPVNRWEGKKRRSPL